MFSLCASGESHARRPASPALWRGTVEHVASKAMRHVDQLSEIVDFIEAMAALAGDRSYGPSRNTEGLHDECAHSSVAFGASKAGITAPSPPSRAACAARRFIVHRSITCQGMTHACHRQLSGCLYR
jgi:hypothetical protein